MRMNCTAGGGHDPPWSASSSLVLEPFIESMTLRKRKASDLGRSEKAVFLFQLRRWAYAGERVKEREKERERERPVDCWSDDNIG